jgi:hypothetical protein
MKTILCAFILMVLFTNYSQAQPSRGENPKFNDPSFNPYENVLDDTARGKRTARFLKNFIVPDELRDRFNASPCNDFVVLGDARVEQFNAFVSKFLSMPSDPKQMKIAEENFKKTGCAKTMGEINYNIELLEKQGSYTGDANEPIENLLCRTKGRIQYLKHNLAYLEALKKIFPNTPDVDNALSIARDGIAKYGNNKAMIASIKTNKNAELAEVHMPKAVTQNAEWEGWFKTWFNKEYPGYILVKQALYSTNWYIKKNEISGLPEYRQIGTAIGAKAPDGKCWIIKVDLYQDYIGGKFDSGRYKLAEKKEMLCENLK